MPVLEAYPCVLVLSSTVLAVELIVDLIVDEDYISWCSYLINIPTFVLTSFWVELLGCPVGDYFLLGCVVLGALVSIWVGYCSGVVSGLPVVALYIKYEVTHQSSCFIVWRLKIGSMLYVAEVWEQGITDQPKHQIKNIYPHTDTNNCTLGHFCWFGQIEN